MGLSKKWLAASVAGALPFVLGQSGAAAATDDHDSLAVTYTTTGGDSITCQLDAYQAVEDYGGGYVELFGEYSAVASVPGPGKCDADVLVAVAAPDDGGQGVLEMLGRDTTYQRYMVPNFEPRRAVSRWTIKFSDCASNCDQELLTETK